MTDIIKQQIEQVPKDMKSKYRDLGDSHALVVSSNLEIDGQSVTVSNPIPIDITDASISITADNAIPVIQLPNDTSLIDAFGRQRVSEPFTIYDSQNQYNKSPLFWDEIISGTASGTHLPNESSVRLRVGTASGDSIARQTRRYLRYQPGKSQLILMTFVLGASKTNVRKRLGYFDSQNGILLEQTSSGLFFVERSYVTGTAVDSRIAQSSWNVDTFDGNGPSGKTLDQTKGQILIIDLEWLGLGRVRIGFVIDGIIYYAHEFLKANLLTSVYMTTANLPLRYEITNTGTTASQTDLIQICSQVSSEGGVQERNLTFSASNGITLRTVANTLLPVLSIDISTVFPAGASPGITNRETVVPIKYDIYSEDSAIFYQVIYNGTLTNPSWVNADTTHSGVRYDVSATAITGGVIIDSGYISSTAQAKSSELNELVTDLFLTLNAIGTVGDILTIACIRITNTSSDVGISLTWKELY